MGLIPKLRLRSYPSDKTAQPGSPSGVLAGARQTQPDRRAPTRPAATTKPPVSVSAPFFAVLGVFDAALGPACKHAALGLAATAASWTPTYSKIILDDSRDARHRIVFALACCIRTAVRGANRRIWSTSGIRDLLVLYSRTESYRRVVRWSRGSKLARACVAAGRAD